MGLICAYRFILTIKGAFMRNPEAEVGATLYSLIRPVSFGILEENTKFLIGKR